MILSTILEESHKHSDWRMQAMAKAFAAMMDEVEKRLGPEAAKAVFVEANKRIEDTVLVAQFVREHYDVR